MRVVTGDVQAGEMGRLKDVVLLHTEAEEFKQYENVTIGDIAELRGGLHEVDVILDLALADIATMFFWEVFDASKARAWQKEVVGFEYGVAGVSDGGAHTKFLTAGRYPTEYLTKWVRDSAWISPEHAHWQLSGYPAFCCGFRDRGVIREAAAADIVIYDFANLEVLPPEVTFDLPANEWRRVQRAKGYRYVIVNGRVTIEDDEQTGMHSGQLLRNGAGRALSVT